MLFRLSETNVNQLKTLPESGMGYQLVETTGSEYTTKVLAVFNGKYGIELRSLKYSQLLKVVSGNDFLVAFEKGKEIQTNIIGIYNQKKQLSSLQELDHSSKKGAKEQQVENANGDELFVRLSAFEDDIRIDKIGKRLLPGSYTTSAADALKCKTLKDNPVERYALPTDLIRAWAFYIEPKPTDKLQRGWVQPDFGKKGGGREMFFEKGTSLGTFIVQSKW